MFHNSLAQWRKPLHNGHLGTKGKRPLWGSRSVIIDNNFFGGGATCFFSKKGFFQQYINKTQTRQKQRPTTRYADQVGVDF